VAEAALRDGFWVKSWPFEGCLNMNMGSLSEFCPVVTQRVRSACVQGCLACATLSGFTDSSCTRQQ